MMDQTYGALDYMHGISLYHRLINSKKTFEFMLKDEYVKKRGFNQLGSL